MEISEVKGYIAEKNIQEKLKDLENTKEIVKEFEKKYREKKAKRIEFLQELERSNKRYLYITKLLNGWNNKRFKVEYLK